MGFVHVRVLELQFPLWRNLNIRSMVPGCGLHVLHWVVPLVG